MFNFKNLINNEFYRNVFTLISATSAAQALAILIYPLLTRIYTAEEHGIFGLYMSIISITTIISTGKYELSVLLPKSHTKSITLIVLSILLSLAFSCFLLVLIALGGKNFASVLGNEKIYKSLYLVPVSTLLVAVFQSLSYWTNRHKRYRKMAGANMIQSITNSLVKVSSSKAFPNGGGLILGALAGQATGAMIYIIDFLRNDRKLLQWVSKEHIIRAGREYNLFPKFSMVHYLVNNFSTSLPIFALSSFFSTENAGLYSVAFIIVFKPMSLLTSSLSQVFSQRIIAKFNNGQNTLNDVRRLIIKLLQIGILPFAIAFVSGPALFSFVLGENWSESGRYMQIIIPWLFIVFISSPLSFLPDLMRKQEKAMWIDIVKFLLRLGSVVTGIYFKNIYVLLIGFSISGVLVTLYSFTWYIALARLADRMKPVSYVKSEITLNDAQDM